MKDLYNTSTANAFDGAEFVGQIKCLYSKMILIIGNIFLIDQELNTDHSIDIYGLRAFVGKKSSYATLCDNNGFQEHSICYGCVCLTGSRYITRRHSENGDGKC